MPTSLSTIGALAGAELCSALGAPGAAVPAGGLCAPWVCARVRGRAMLCSSPVAELLEQGFTQQCYGANAIQNCQRCLVLSVVKQQKTADTVRASLLTGSQESKG